MGIKYNITRLFAVVNREEAREILHILGVRPNTCGYHQFLFGDKDDRPLIVCIMFNHEQEAYYIESYYRLGHVKPGDNGEVIEYNNEVVEFHHDNYNHHELSEQINFQTFKMVLATLDKSKWVNWFDIIKR